MRVELKDIRKHFGTVRANDGISLTFEPGHIYGLLGENGAGKSTLMKILSGYQPPTSGIVMLDGKPVSFVSPAEALKRGVGMLYQDPLDFPPLRVVENHLLAYDHRLLLDTRTGMQELRSYRERFGFETDPQSFVDTLTLGERQQMELMRLLALGADFLILDEPTTGISAEQKELLFSTMRRLAHEEQKTIILVSHKLEEIQELCDEVAVLRRGKLMGTKEVPCPTNNLVRLMFGEKVPRVEEDGGQAALESVVHILRLENIAIRTYRLNVENINLELREGEVLGLAGLEGSGQRLLLQACAGLLPVHDGQVLLDGEPIKGKRSPFFWVPWATLALWVIRVIWLIVRLISGQISGLGLAGGIVVATLIAGGIWLAGAALISWTGQSPYHEFQQRGGAYVPAGRLEEGLVAGLSLTEHMALATPSQKFVIDWSQTQNEIDSRIRQYNVIGRPETLVNELSGGNQQRAMLALLNSPLRLILLEHPTRGLDVTSVNWVWELFQKRRREGTAIMFISADLDELLERSDRIAVFSGGVMSRILKTSETSVDELGHLIGGQQS